MYGDEQWRDKLVSDLSIRYLRSEASVDSRFCDGTLTQREALSHSTCLGAAHWYRYSQRRPPLQFSLDRIHRAGAVVDEEKLRHINRLHMHRICAQGLDPTINEALASCVATLRSYVGKTIVEPPPVTLEDAYLAKVVDTMKVCA